MQVLHAMIPILFLAACSQSSTPGSGLSGRNSPQDIMLNVAKQAQLCWFRKKDPALSKYKMATELNSFSGKPRILIVPKNNPGGLPRLVAQAERKSGRTSFTSFGPLLDSQNGPRLNASLRSWAQGSKTC